jgi:uncharacterized protein YceK
LAVKRTLLVTMTLCTTWVNGCGTICNVTSGDLLPYGGVRQDFKWIKSSTPNAMNGGLVENSSGPSGVSGSGGAAVVGVLAAVILRPFAPLIIIMIELPLSVAGDTIMFPVEFWLHPHYLRELREDWDD